MEGDSRYRQAHVVFLLFWSAACLVGIPLESHAALAEDKAALFEQVFGPKDPSAKSSVPVEMFVDGREAGMSIVVVTNDGRFRVETEALIQAITPVASEETLAALHALAAQSQFARPADFGSLGIQVEYDPARLRLTIEPDPILRSRKNISLKGDRGAANGQSPQAADFSLLVNVNASGNFARTGDSGTSGWQSGNISLETVARLHDWVFESEAFYQSAAVNRWRRGDLRLVRDDISRGTRLIIGDQHWPAQPLMRGRSLAGLSLIRNFNIQPYQTTQPTGYREFLLESLSTVDIYVNDQLRQSLTLGPGTYSVSDLPLVYGANDVRLKIVNAYGQESQISVPVYNGHRLLARGLKEFGLVAGFPSVFALAGRRYDIDHPLASAFYRTGYSDTVTLGITGEMAANSWMIGTQASLATQLGNFVINVGAGKANHGNPGFAAQLGYRLYQDPGPGRKNRIWDFSAVRLPRNYLGETSATAASAQHRLALRMTQAVTARSNLSLSVNHKSGPDVASVFSAVVSFAYRTRSGLTFRLSGYTFFNSSDTPGDAYSLSYSYPFGHGKQSFQGDFDSRSNRRSTNWQVSPASADFGASAELRYAEDRHTRVIDSLVGFRGNRFDASIDHRYAGNLNTETGSSQFTRLNFSTALVMADGAFGITRHVADSFAIAVPHENYAQFQIGLKSRNSNHEATSGLLGAAVTSRLTSYESHQLEVNVSNLPLGYDIRNTNPTVKPKYRSGIIIPVGNSASVILRGRLLSLDGTPVTLRAGILRFLGKDNGEQLRFFTNRSGKFTIAGVRSGRYQILLDSSGRSAEFSIPTDASGVYNYGELRL